MNLTYSSEDFLMHQRNSSLAHPKKDCFPFNESKVNLLFNPDDKSFGVSENTPSKNDRQPTSQLCITSSSVSSSVLFRHLHRHFLRHPHCQLYPLLIFRAK